MNYMNLWNKFTNIFYNTFIKNLFRFKGRASRREYITRILTMAVLVYLLDKLEIHYKNSWSVPIVFISFGHLAIVIAYFIQFFFLVVRRLHDCNRSGWWQLLTFLPFGQLIMILLALYKGTPGSNKYGEPPEY